MNNRIKEAIQQSIAIKQQILDNPQMLSLIEQSTDVIVNAYEQNKKVLFCGNGGSASDAQHLAAELSGRFYFDRPPLESEALHVNTSYLTAVANDYGYDKVYSRAIRGTGKEGDVLIGLSTSGNSENIVNAFKVAKEKGMITIGFTGASGGEMKDVSDILLAVSSKDTPRIQESHILMGHIICELVESTMFINE